MSFAHRVSTQIASTTTRSISKNTATKKSTLSSSSRKSVGVRAVITEPVASAENKAAYDYFSGMLGDYLVDYKVISRHRLSLAFMGLYELYARAIFFLLFLPSRRLRFRFSQKPADKEKLLIILSPLLLLFSYHDDVNRHSYYRA